MTNEPGDDRQSRGASPSRAELDAISRAASREVERRRKLTRAFTVLLLFPIALLIVIWVLPEADRKVTSEAADEARKSRARAEDAAGRAAGASDEAGTAARQARESGEAARRSRDEAQAAAQRAESAWESLREALPATGPAAADPRLDDLDDELAAQRSELAELRRLLESGRPAADWLEDLQARIARQTEALGDLEQAIAGLAESAASQDDRIDRIVSYLGELEPTFYRSYVVPERMDTELHGLDLTIRIERQGSGEELRVGLTTEGRASAFPGGEQGSSRPLAVGESAEFRHAGERYVLTVLGVLQRWGPARDFIHVDVYRYRQVAEPAAAGPPADAMTREPDSSCPGARPRRR